MALLVVEELEAAEKRNVRVRQLKKNRFSDYFGALFEVLCSHSLSCRTRKFTFFTNAVTDGAVSGAHGVAPVTFSVDDVVNSRVNAPVPCLGTLRRGGRCVNPTTGISMISCGGIES